MARTLGTYVDAINDAFGELRRTDESLSVTTHARAVEEPITIQLDIVRRYDGGVISGSHCWNFNVLLNMREGVDMWAIQDTVESLLRRLRS